jgi:1-acyl-sn-glycerol-3-phosphate acyltransferase
MIDGMKKVVAGVRMVLLAIGFALGALAVLVAALWPWRIRGVRPANWAVVGLSHVLCWLLRVQIVCQTPERLRGATGFVFPNHLSLLDPLVLMTLMPLRFVAAVEVLSYPVLGWMAKSVGTVFVARQDRTARKQARSEIATALQVDPQPPIVLFPEGRLGPGASLYPFRFGAFAIAVEEEIAYVPCGLRYRPLDVVVWHGAAGETLMSALWRLAMHMTPIRVDVLPLPIVQPRKTDNPEAMAQQAQIDIAAALELPLTPTIPPIRYNWHEPAT